MNRKNRKTWTLQKKHYLVLAEMVNNLIHGPKHTIRLSTGLGIGFSKRAGNPAYKLNISRRDCWPSDGEVSVFQNVLAGLGMENIKVSPGRTDEKVTHSGKVATFRCVPIYFNMPEAQKRPLLAHEAEQRPFLNGYQ